MKLLQLGRRYSQEIEVIGLISRKVGLTPNATISVLSPRRNTSLLGDFLYWSYCNSVQEDCQAVSMSKNCTAVTKENKVNRLCRKYS